MGLDNHLIEALERQQGLRKLPPLLKNLAVKLLCMHRSGRTMHNGPKAPLKPSMELMTSTEICRFLHAVNEATTAQEAVTLWNPTNTPTTKVKRLLKTPPKASMGQGGSQGGS